MLLKYLQIFRTPKIGTKTFYKLMKQHQNDADRILDFLKFRGFDIPSFSSIQKEVDVLTYQKGHLLYIDDLDYPVLLKHIIDPPPFLSFYGNRDLFNQRAISLVGARNASHMGQKFAYKLSQDIAEKKYVVVSGLARGIDTAAHKGSIHYGTIAVLAGGIDQLYPAENKTLYESIKEDGIVLSEMPFGTSPSTQLFARRNRLISGLSRGVIIMEAARHSGSMITADFALQQGREVFAVPGFPGDPRSHGGHFLIQQGAHLLHTVDDVFDVLENLPPLAYEPQEKKESVLIKQPQRLDAPEIHTDNDDLLNFLSSKPFSIEEVLNLCPTLSVSDLMSRLFQLELEGKIEIKNQSVIRLF